jgi:CubicO group peptidase (beta-lactamase class C family)
MRAAALSLRFLSRFPVLLLAALSACGDTSERPLAARIAQVFEAAHSAGDFNGSVLVTRDGTIVYQGSFGLADEVRRIPNSSATKYVAFSVLKPMTAVLVFQQIEAGTLRLDDRLDGLFPSLAGKPAGGITIRQLLSHTSGIEDVIGLHTEHRITVSDLESARVLDNGSFEYSSAGFVCLALVLERVTGLEYGRLLNERIFVPAGMSASGLLRSHISADGLATGYREDDGVRVVAPLGVAPEVLDGAGSLYTTVGDLALFDQALRSEKILSRRMQEEMLTRLSGDRAYGWSLGEQDGRYFPWHQGSFRGFTSIYVRQVHRREVIAILSNDQETDVLGLRTQVLRLLKRDAAASER